MDKPIVTSIIDALDKRSPLGWLRERDIDLLLCAELHSNVDLQAKLFSLAWLDAFGHFYGAWVSHADSDGETDLIVGYRNEHQRYYILIENKIAATFQPEQGERYLTRANRLRQTEQFEVVTLLLAPRAYFQRSGAEHFELHIAYEDIIDWLKVEKDPRSMFLAGSIARGIEDYKRGYVSLPDEKATNIWLSIWCHACDKTPSLRMKRPNPKPMDSKWVYFRQAEGFTSQVNKMVSLVYKAERGQADLQFRQMKPEILQRMLGHLLEGDMTIESANQSTSIRLQVPIIEFHRPGSEQSGNIIEGLSAIERLRVFFIKNKVFNYFSSDSN